MALFDELASKLREGGLKAASAAKDAAGIAKLTADMKAEELKMLDTYKEIGKLFCAKAEGDVDPEFLPLLKKIEDAKAKIAGLKEEKERMKTGAPEAAEEVVEDAEEVAETVDVAVEEAAEAVEEVVEEVKAVVEETVEEVAETAEETVEELKEDFFAE